MFGYIKFKYNFFIINHILENQNQDRAMNIKRRCLARLGNNIANSARIMGPLYSHCKLTIGHNTFVGTQFRCEGNGSVIIGDDCDIAPQVTILTGTHMIGNKERRAGKGITTDVIIGNGTWICAKSCILPGIKIGNGCIIGAGAVVTKDVPDNHKALGVPARNIPIED